MRLVSDYTVEKLIERNVLMPEGQSILKENSIYSLNETARWYLEQLKEEKTFEELAASAEIYFEADSKNEKAIIRNDLKSFLDILRRQGLLEE